MIEPVSARRRDQVASIAILVAALGYGLLAAGAYQWRLLGLAGCYAIAIVGYQRLFGELGVLSLAQGAFFAIGAYAVALLNGHGVSEMALALPAAIATAILVAALCSLPLLRLGSHYLALASLALAMLVLLAAINLDGLTGGANGLILSTPPRWLGMTATDNAALAAIVAGMAIVAALAYWASGGGLATLRRLALRDTPRAAAALGLRASTWQRGAFCFAAALAALGGALYAPLSGVVSPQVAELTLMVNLLAAATIGGRGKVSGALLGALLLVLLPEALRFAGNWYLFLWGAALLFMLIVMPAGLAGLLDAALTGRIAPRWTTAPRQAPAPLREAELRLQELHKSFGGVVAVDGVSLELHAGQALVVIGPNGAGKTTLLNLVCGTERPDRGRLLWRGADITRSDAPARALLGIARSFQASDLPAGLAALDAVASGAQHMGDLAAARGAAMALLQSLDLADHATVASESLAPAQRRLIEIARAMMARPALLALDEPTAGMSVEARRQLLAALSAWRVQGLALLVIEHDIEFAVALADRLCCLDRGRIEALGEPATLRADPGLGRFFGGAR